MPKDLKKLIKAFPDRPGIYLMKDVSGAIIYIGKAISLKKRVTSYNTGGDERLQIESLLERINDIDFIVTKDERQALVLEADLVRKHQPRYNIRLKDDKAPLLIRLDRSVLWPRIELVRKKLDDGAKYFGPFPFSYEAKTLMEVIERTVLLRTCSDRVLKNRVRPCLQFQIHRCAAPCCFEVSKHDYDNWLDEAIEILKGNVQNVIISLKKQIEIASEQLRFEDAVILRDRLRVLLKLSQDQTQVMYGDLNIDAFGFYREGSSVEVSVLRTNLGRLSDSSSYGFSDVSISNTEIIRSSLIQYYINMNSSIPNQIVLPFDFEDVSGIQDLLSERAGRKVEIIHPQRGIKASLLELANVNSKESFETRFNEKNKNDRILKALKDTFDLEQYPRIIECFDISHIQGKATVGAVVCFKDGRPDPSRYRYFHLSQEGKPDDFASMNEVVRRHLSRTNEEGTTSDLILIDGGPPQLVQALKVRSELGVLYPHIISIAKKRVPLALTKNKTPRGQLKIKKPERVYSEDNPIPVILEPNSEVLHLLERIRNETHRVAITFHRKTRSRLQFVSPLDKIRGLGPVKKKLLLREFGSLQALKLASVEEICERGGVARKLSELIVKSLK